MWRPAALNYWDINSQAKNFTFTIQAILRSPKTLHFCILIASKAILFLSGCKLPPRNSKTNLLAYYDKDMKRPIRPHLTAVPANSDTGTLVVFKCRPGYLLKAWRSDYRCFDYGWYPWVPPTCVKRGKSVYPHKVCLKPYFVASQK